jgi:hypothetical protein
MKDEWNYPEGSYLDPMAPYNERQAVRKSCDEAYDDWVDLETNEKK